MKQKFYWVHTGAYDAIIATAANDERTAVYFTDDGSRDFPHSAEAAETYDVSEIIGMTTSQMEYYRDGNFCGVLDNFDPSADEWNGVETSIWEYTPEQVCYWWFDTEHGGCLYRGERDEDGKKDRDTEVLILTEVYALADIDPNPANWEAEGGTDSMVWKVIDEYIERQLGYLPDYEIN